jgi:hypothetical protein
VLEVEKFLKIYRQVVRGYLTPAESAFTRHVENQVRSDEEL